MGEFHPLGELAESYKLGWSAFDPADEHALYSWYDTAAYDVVANFRWSASEGVVPLDPVLLAFAPDTAVPFRIHQVAQDASAAIADATHLTSFYWSRDGGVQALDVTNPSLSPAGSIIAGMSGRRAVRWTAGSGLAPVAELTSSAVTSHAAGGAVLYVQQRTITHVAASGARTTLEVPSEEPADALFGSLAANASGTAFAVGVFDIATADRRTRPRLYLWSGKTLEQVALPEQLPAGATLDQLTLSDDGRVVVARVVSMDLRQWMLLRGAADEPARVLLESNGVSLRSVSPAGDVIVAQTNNARSDLDLVFRWSPEGPQELDGVSEDAYVALDGDLFVDPAADVPIQKFGRAQAHGTLPIERLPEGFVPAGWKLSTLDAVSPNARLLTGTALDPNGVRWYWLSRSQAVCPEAP